VFSCSSYGLFLYGVSIACCADTLPSPSVPVSSGHTLLFYQKMQAKITKFLTSALGRTSLPGSMNIFLIFESGHSS